MATLPRERTAFVDTALARSANEFLLINAFEIMLEYHEANLSSKREVNLLIQSLLVGQPLNLLIAFQNKVEKCSSR